MQLFERLLHDVEPLGSEDVSKMIATSLDYAKAHLDVVKKWGRFPHRNAVLGRANTPEEDEGLAAGNIAKF